MAPMLASLIPWLAFLAVVVAVDDQASVGRTIGVALPYYAFVGLPSLAVLAVARPGLVRIAGGVVMTAAAVVSALAMATSDDAQAGLAVLWMPMVGLPLGTAVWIGQKVVDRRRDAAEMLVTGAARASDRAAALVVDAVLLGVALSVPLGAMSGAGLEVEATVVGVAVATAYFSVGVAAGGGTIGHRALHLAVVDAETFEPCPPGRAVLRSLLVVMETAAAATLILAPPALAELGATAATGRSLTDRLFRTTVVNA